MRFDERSDLVGIRRRCLVVNHHAEIRPAVDRKGRIFERDQPSFRMAQLLGALAVGAHSITAVYAGDTNFSGSTSSAVSVTVNAAAIATTTTLTASATTAVSGTSITFTALVAPVSGSVIPTGTVSFTEACYGLATNGKLRARDRRP